MAVGKKAGKGGRNDTEGAETTAAKAIPVTAIASYTENKGLHYAATALATKTVQVWQFTPTTKTLMFEIHHHSSVSAMSALYSNGFAYPILITSSGNDAFTWHGNSGAKLKIFSGHSDAVTTLCTYSAPKARTLLLTGSRDKTVMLWDLLNGERLRVLDPGYAVNSIAVVPNNDDGSSFLVTTAGKAQHATVHVEYAFSYPMLPHTIYTLFERDSESKVRQNYTWDRLRSIADASGPRFWQENCHLFTTLFSLKSEDSLDVKMIVSFYVTFASVLPTVIHRLPDVKGSKLLKYVLDKRIPVHQIVLSAWISALHTPCDTFVRQMFHPCNNFEIDNLLLLAKLFPSEFVAFLCKVQLVQSHELLHRKCTSYPFENPQKWIVEGMRSTVSSNMWAQAGYFTDSTSPGAQPVTAHMIPLIGVANDAMLKAVVDTSVRLDDMAVFDSQVGMAAFGYAWTAFGRYVHIRAFIAYSVFLAIFTASVTAFDRLQRSHSDSERAMAWVLQALVLLFNLYYVLDEVVQMSDSKMRAQLLAKVTRSKESLASNVQTLQNLFSASDAPANTTLAKTPETAKKVAKVESVKVRGKRAKRGSLIDNIPAVREPAPAAAAAAATETPGGTAPTTPVGVRDGEVPDAEELTEEQPPFSLRLWLRARVISIRKAILGWVQRFILFDVVVHFCDFWNGLDLVLIALVFAGTLLRCAYVRETNQSRCVLAVASVFAWFKLLYFMRPFKESGLLGKIVCC
jgi:hypothetical protein